MSDDPSFMKRDEVAKIHPVTDRSRSRAEDVGLFPKRILLAPKIAAWRRSEVHEWQNDPSAWAQRRRAARG